MNRLLKNTFCELFKQTQTQLTRLPVWLFLKKISMHPWQKVLKFVHLVKKSLRKTCRAGQSFLLSTGLCRRFFFSSVSNLLFMMASFTALENIDTAVELWSQANVWPRYSKLRKIVKGYGGLVGEDDVAMNFCAFSSTTIPLLNNVLSALSSAYALILTAVNSCSSHACIKKVSWYLAVHKRVLKCSPRRGWAGIHWTRINTRKSKMDI